MKWLISNKQSFPLPALLSRHSLNDAMHAAIIMAIGMGFGRFAFTAVYPHMVDEGILSVQDGSIAASANYLGYMIGALLSIRVRAGNARIISMVSIAGTVVCLAALAVLQHPWEVASLRGVAGAFSALSMVAGSLWLLDHRQQAHRAPLLYGGVGVGIALSAELLVLASSMGLHSQGLWLTLAVASAALGAAAIQGLAASRNTPVAAIFSKPLSQIHQKDVRPAVLVLIYTLAGFGYIVTATYLPLLVKTALPGLNAAHVWAIFGLGAAPSCMLWHRLHTRLGTRTALMLNLTLQAIGVALPIVANSAVAYLSCALLVGGTFMGTVTIAMPAAQRIAKKVRGNLMATMTTMYGLGQIVGPALAATLYSHSHSFTYSLVAAASALLLGAVGAIKLY